MSKTFKIILAVLLGLIYYSCIPSIAVVQLAKYNIFRNSILGAIVSWAILLFPIILAAILLFLNKRNPVPK